MSFALDPATDHFADSFARVVDLEWLSRDDGEARVLRQIDGRPEQDLAGAAPRDIRRAPLAAATAATDVNRLPAWVDAGRLRQVLAAHAASVRLIVLAACEGANVGDPGNYLGGAAQALHRARSPR